MKPDIKELTKLYYSISEVAEMYDVSKSLIRYWETEFNFLKPHKNSKGDRRFTKQNIEQLGLIYFLVKEKGFTLEGAKKELTAQKSRNRRKNEIIQKLERIKKKMGQLMKKMD